MRNEAIRRFSYADQSSRFAAACEWLRKLGIKMDSSRLATYARDLEQIDRYFSEGKISELTERDGYAPLMNSLIEATELMDVHEGLNKMQPSTNFVARLKKFLGGPIMLVDEKSPSNVARSTGFELLVAALLANAGLPVSFDSTVDVLVPIAPNPIGIECKRPLSHSKMERRIREGIQQLEEFYKAAEKRRGILALSVSKVENDGSRLLPARDASDLDSKAFALIDQFRQRHEWHWREALSSRTVAVLLHLRAPSPVESPSLLTIATHAGWVALDFPNSNGRETLQQIAGPIDAFVQKQRAA
jgi:hypothetical protein